MELLIPRDAADVDLLRPVLLGGPLRGASPLVLPGAAPDPPAERVAGRHPERRRIRRARCLACLARPLRLGRWDVRRRPANLSMELTVARAS